MYIVDLISNGGISLLEWGIVSLISQAVCQKWDVEIHHVTSDALGGWGCAAVIRSKLLQLRWPPAFHNHITTKELVPIVLAAALWGREWTAKTVMACCNNAAVVVVLNKGSRREG